MSDPAAEDLRALYPLADTARAPRRRSAPRTAEDGPHPHDLFAAIRGGDILLHHPYDSFEPVVDFIQPRPRPRRAGDQADPLPDRRNSELVQALIDAAESGKQVAVLVELKARFDEEANIAWAAALEERGRARVLRRPGLKTHAKVLLVVRREGRGVRRYVHLGTGNYNAKTARLYTDFGLLTTDRELVPTLPSSSTR